MGLHPAAMEYLAERRAVVLGSDSNHEFEDLVPVCEQEGRWLSLCIVAPLRLPQATGSARRRW